MSASSSVADVDAWIAQLQDCKQLSENDIKKLCDKVQKKRVYKNRHLIKKLIFERRVKSSCKNPMYNLLNVQ